MRAPPSALDTLWATRHRGPAAGVEGRAANQAPWCVQTNPAVAQTRGTWRDKICTTRASGGLPVGQWAASGPPRAVYRESAGSPTALSCRNSSCCNVGAPVVGVVVQRWRFDEMAVAGQMQTMHTMHTMRTMRETQIHPQGVDGGGGDGRREGGRRE